MIPTDSKLPRNTNVASYREVIKGSGVPANCGTKAAEDWMQKLRRYEKIDETASDLEQDVRSKSGDRMSIRSGSGLKKPRPYSPKDVP